MFLETGNLVGKYFFNNFDKLRKFFPIEYTTSENFSWKPREIISSATTIIFRLYIGVVTFALVCITVSEKNFL